MKSEVNLSGKEGEIYLGHKKIATKTEWQLGLKRDYVSAASFGPDSKTFRIPPPKISGTFSGNLDMLAGSIVELDDDGDFVISFHQSVRPAWWGRLKHRIQRTDWPTYAVVSGKASIEWSAIDDAATGSFHFVAPVTISSPPMSPLERRWNLFCWRVKHPRSWFR